jgi:hypothetical protein
MAQAYFSARLTLSAASHFLPITSWSLLIVSNIQKQDWVCNFKISPSLQIYMVTYSLKVTWRRVHNIHSTWLFVLHYSALSHRTLATQKKLAYFGFQCLDHPYIFINVNSGLLQYTCNVCISPIAVKLITVWNVLFFFTSWRMSTVWSTLVYSKGKTLTGIFRRFRKITKSYY